MKQNEQNIDDFFKSGLGSYTETPPPAVWGALEKKLDGANKPGFAGRWYMYLALASMILILGLSVSRVMTSSLYTAHKGAASSNNAMVHPVAASAPIGNSSAANPVLPPTAGIKDENVTPGDNNTNDANQNQQPIHNSKPLTGPAGNANDNPKHAAGDSKNTLARIAKHAPGNNNTHNYGSSVGPSSLNNKVESEKTHGLPTAEVPVGDSHNEIAPGKEPAPGMPAANIKVTALMQKQKADSINRARIARAAHKFPVKTKPVFDRFEAGIKGGFERGFDNDASKKAVISPYIQYNISPRFAIMAQPAVKYSTFNVGNIGGPKSYYKENGDSVVSAGATNPVIISGEGVVAFYLTDFNYSQSHDSIVKSYTYSGTYMEYELPILLKYYIAKTFSVYGGVNVTYSKLTGITENTYTNVVLRDTILPVVSGSSQTPAHPSTASEIKYTGTPYSSYTGPLYPSPQGSMLRFGYMFGFSYEFTGRWLFDGLVQQGMVKPNMIGGYNTNAPLSAPYFRFTIGYKIIK
jgi:hypothetical protein